MDRSACATRALFDLDHTLAKDLLARCTYPWEALEGLGELFSGLFSGLGADYAACGGGVFIHRTARVAPTAFIAGPAVVGPRTEIRHCAFLRGNVLLGEDCVVGNSVELKNCILFDGVQVPHLSYVGDSILGRKAHMGAGAIVSNLKSDRSAVTIRADTAVPTGRKKCGAFLGDRAEIGCGSVLCPGTVVGRDTTVYPLTLCRGCYPAHSIVKQGAVVAKK